MQSEDEAQETPPSSVVARLDDLAKAAGMLPEFLATGKPSRPVEQNPKFWLYRAICVRNRWNEHSQVTQEDFDDAVKAVANFTV